MCLQPWGCYFEIGILKLSKSRTLYHSLYTKSRMKKNYVVLGCSKVQFYVLRLLLASSSKKSKQFENCET